jgi:hypothetical protein
MAHLAVFSRNKLGKTGEARYLVYLQVVYPTEAISSERLIFDRRI